MNCGLGAFCTGRGSNHPDLHDGNSPRAELTGGCSELTSGCSELTRKFHIAVAKVELGDWGGDGLGGGGGGSGRGGTGRGRAGYDAGGRPPEETGSMGGAGR
jgi:hypothetical protein